MKLFHLPIEAREENLDRACDIAESEAVAACESVYTLFQGVPLVATPHDKQDEVKANWQKLFDQFQADKTGLEPEPGPATPAEPEPPTPARKWYDKWWGNLTCLAIITAVLFTDCRGIQGFFADWDKAHPKPTVASGTITLATSQHFSYLSDNILLLAYDNYNNRLWINVDEWKRVIGCSPLTTLQTSETGIGGPYGNTRMELTPYCVAPVVAPKPKHKRK